MNTTELSNRTHQFEIPGRLTVNEGRGGLPKLTLTTDTSTAEIYLHGAHVTDFRLRNQSPVLFMSQQSRFESGQPIRGGIPVIFPWFGARDGEAMHGFARTASWEWHEASTTPDGGVSVRLHLPFAAHRPGWPRFYANYSVSLTDRLTLELILTNAAAERSLVVENCLHTYFAVGAVEEISIHGLKGGTYLDKLQQFAACVEANDAVRIASEVDRVYLNTVSPVEIVDPTWRRKVRIEKSGSASTVVWNPWIAKSKQMPDFGDEEYHEMVCVESGNVAQNKLELPPGQSAVLKVTLSTLPL